MTFKERLCVAKWNAAKLTNALSVSVVHAHVLQCARGGGRARLEAGDPIACLDVYDEHKPIPSRTMLHIMRS